MKEIILYGAGKRGMKIARLLLEHGIQVGGFCDSIKSGEIVVGENKIDIIPLDKIDSDKYMVIITIADYDQAVEVRKKIEEYKIEITTVEKFLNLGADVVSNNRHYIAEYHEELMNEYFEEAENLELLNIFWGKDSIFKQRFMELNKDKIVELACGRGRHVPQYISYANEIALVDILEKNIDYCRARFGEIPKISYYVNNGYDLRNLESETYTSLFTYDAMVHFEMLDIFQYLKETYRILISGGRALFHHSNNTEDYKITFSTATHGRNYMSKDLFAHLADRAGLIVLEQNVIEWNGVPGLDCITLVEKP